jgi:hypothetical protein
MSKFLFAIPAAQVIFQDKYEKGVHVGRDLVEVVSAFRGLIWAIETIATGEKIHDVRAFRKILIDSYDEKNIDNDAKFLLLTAEEKGFIDQAVKTFDWTFGGKVQFWVRWDEFFDSVTAIKPYDESNPDATYVEWKRDWDAKQEAKKAEKLRLEQEAIERKRQEEIKAAQILSEEIQIVLAAKLEELKNAGKFGVNATVEDLPADVRAAAEATARANIAAKAVKTESAHAEPAVINVPVETVPEVPAVEADEII